MKSAHCNHNVFFYLSDNEFPDSLHHFFTTAVQSGCPMVLVMTPVHRELFEMYMRSHYLSPRVMRSANLLVQLDAEETLKKFWNPEGVNAVKFKNVIGGLLIDNQKYHAGKQLWAYGEMVNVLHANGYHDHALELEALWNELADEMRFSLLCGYHLDLATDSNNPDFINAVCEAHSNVLSLKCDEQSKRLQRHLSQKLGDELAHETWSRACAERKNLPQSYRVLLWLRDMNPELAQSAFELLQTERVTA